MAATAAASFAGSSGSSVYAVSKEKTNGTRLFRLVLDEGTHVLRSILHSVHPPATLQRVLNNNKKELEEFVKFDDQRETLFPASGNPPDSKTFDITLLHLLLRTICKLKRPRTGWHKMPKDGDSSREANIVRIKLFRDELCHSVSTRIADDEFEAKWNIVSSALVALGLNQTKVDGMRTAPIDHDTERRIKEEVNKRSRAFPELRSCLLDKLPDKRMFGRTQEIKEVKEFVQSGEVAVVMITGGPGFGKTTVAKEVAHELANPDRERTVIFCRLRTKRDVSEVATEMIDSQGDGIHTHVPENPARWLKEWSKQIKTPVTFVLDNADDVLELKDRSFLEILSDVRMFSRQNVTFVVTSRKTFNNDDLNPKVVRLKEVSVQEAKNILIAEASNEDVQPKLSRPERIVELCGRVPLALCIVGSLLSDNAEEKLIKRLEKEPLTTLDNGETSMETVIRTSFDLLMKDEQDAFIVMSVFPGQFNLAAAEAVMKACSVSRFDLILRSLKMRSLLEPPSSGRYQMHPLIQAFAKKIGEDEQPDLFAAGQKLACTHFMSCLAENANRYWSKDGFRESVKAFNADRNNFEYFLDIYTQGREKEDCDLTESCKTFLHDFPQKCRYLEMCALPNFYISILRRLLNTFDSESQPVHRVELLCLLGHEARKVGDTTTYNDFMEEAKQLYEEKCADFETNPLSEVNYLNSFARFLLEQKGTDKPMNVYLKSLQIGEKKLPEHPERAATLLFAGRLHKTRKEEKEAGQKIKQAGQLFDKCLGEHFMTALCRKQFADLLFFSRNKTELNRTLSHYKKALEMMKKLGMDGHKESILTLRNYGSCHKNKGNFEEARNLLKEAERIAEIELDDDHMWKVRVKTEQALLYEEEGKEDQMMEAMKVMKEGLEMCYRLGQTVERLGNIFQIREFLDRYPKTFPVEKYPR